MNGDSRVTARTPAKINLGLEITGRRDDGYHNIVSILQTVDVYDEFAWQATGLAFQYLGLQEISISEDLFNRVIQDTPAAEQWTGRLSIEKRIPIGAGLGGGSSDAALALRLAGFARHSEWLHERAEMYGSDVPFLLSGGTALATGWGTALEPLPTPNLWFVIIVPSVRIEQKTRTLYSGLSNQDLSDGSTVYAIARAIEAGSCVTEQLPNAFVRQLRTYRQFVYAWDVLENAGARQITASGAGPSILAVVHHRQAAARIAEQVKGDFERVYVARAIPNHRGDSAVLNLARAVRGYPILP